MLKKSWILLGALITIIVFATFFYSSNYQSQGQVIRSYEIAPEIQPPITTIPTPETPELKEFSITAKRFDFTPETITVNQGDLVRLTITSIDTTHGFFISEYGINERLVPGETIIVEFIADKKGEFSMICNIVCGSGHGDMRGKLVVN